MDDVGGKPGELSILTEAMMVMMMMMVMVMVMMMAMMMMMVWYVHSSHW